MKGNLLLGILGGCIAGQGCGPIALGARTLVLEPVHYCVTADNLLETHRDYKLAEQAWESIARAEPDHRYSPDYAAGFKDGFADYLYAGGTGEPPPLPPRHYWKVHFQTPQGHQAIVDWFAGFRHGAGVAQQSGYRQWVIIPSSLPPREGPDREPSSITPESVVAPPSEPVLPAPRTVAPPRVPHEGEPGKS